MAEFLRKLFSSDFMPHGMCYLWEPGVLWLNVISDGLIAASYFAIPFLLFAFAKRRRDLTFQWIFVAFGLFIMACGTTHLMGVWTVWYPTYRLEGVVKAVTAGSSILTAVLLVPLLPTLVKLPSPTQLAAVNAALAKEIEERKAAEAEVRRVNATLEQRIAERTAELEASNRELMDSNKRYRFLADAMPQIVWTSRPDGWLDYYNQRWYQYTGMSHEQTQGWGWGPVVHPDDLPATVERWSEAVASGKEYQIEYRFRRASDGAYRWHLGRATPRRDENGEIVQWVGTGTDIDDLKRATESLEQANNELREAMLRRERLEEQLRQAQKMEAVGRLAGGVAHDFNNLLTGIAGFSDLLLEEAGTTSARLADYAREIQVAAGRAASLTNQLLAFSRRQEAHPRILNLNDVVAGIEKMLGRIIGEDIELVRSLAPDLGSVLIDPGQADQIIMNLAVNARDAMPAGGRLTIETSETVLAESDVGRHVGVAPGPYVSLAITDTGVGMDALTRERLFEPFFTTKEVGKGTGLGLSIVYGIVKQNGGDIRVYSEPGKGSTFRVYLPLAAEQSEAAPEEPETSVPGQETVLLVEDEEVVRKFARAVLERRGYCVLEASSPGRAVQVAQSHGPGIHVLLTDVVMPEMSGPELAARLAGSHPEMRVLYMSGYPHGHIARQGLLDEDTAYIQKPFTSAALHRKIRQVLA